MNLIIFELLYKFDNYVFINNLTTTFNTSWMYFDSFFFTLFKEKNQTNQSRFGKKIIFFSTVKSVDDYYYYKLVKGESSNLVFNKELMSIEKNLTLKADKKMWTFIYNEFNNNFFSELNSEESFFQKKQPIMVTVHYQIYSFLFKIFTFFNIKLIGSQKIFDLITDHNQDPFFTFWKNIIISKRAFFYINHFWERSFLMQDTLLKKSNSKISKILNPYTNVYESNRGMWILYNFLVYRTYTNNYILWDFTDVQDFAFDKNFFFLWDYKWAFKKYPNIMIKARLMDWKNYFKNRLLMPMLQYPSSYTYVKSPQVYGWSWEKALSYFPTYILQAENNNMYLDKFVAGYSWFFKAGETYFDNLNLLEKQWYWSTHINYGQYDYLIFDFPWYQMAYMTSVISYTWFAIEMLILEEYSSSRKFQYYIWKYDTMFQFYQDPYLKKNLWADLLFKKKPLERLKVLRDPIDDMIVIVPKEWITSLIFGYNPSIHFFHTPKWFLDLNDNTDFYLQIKADTREDQRWESLDYVSTFYMYNYHNKLKPNVSLFTKDNYKVLYLGHFISFINEKIHNDPGYINSLFNFTYYPAKKTNFNYLGLMDIFYDTQLPPINFSWSPFSSIEYWTEWLKFEENIDFIRRILIQLYKNIEFGLKDIKFTKIMFSKYNIWYSNSTQTHFYITIKLPEIKFISNMLIPFFNFMLYNFEIPDIYKNYYLWFIYKLPKNIWFELFMWTVPRLELVCFNDCNNTLWFVILQKLDNFCSPIPLDFFFLNSNLKSYPDTIHTITHKNQLLPTNFFEKSVFTDYSENEIKKFLILWGLTRHYLNDDFTHDVEFLMALASINNNKYQNPELQRYKDYVIKSNLYKQPGTTR